MFPRIRFAVVVACAVVASLAQVERAAAVDAFWQGDVSSAYSLNGNWNFIAGGTLSPRSSQGERAVIGTDDPAGALSSDAAPFGSPMITANTLAPGGVALGLRVIDYDDLNFNGQVDDFLIEPAPAAGALVGRLTIGPGGNLAPTTSSAAGVGADGRVLVGVHGRGFLTMTGGTLTAPGLVVAGETNSTVGANTSLVDLSGSSSLQITGGASGTATFGRRLKVTGPSVNFNSTGQLRLQSTNTYTAAITSATAHSPLKTGAAALVGGGLLVEFSGAAATRDPITSLGQTWTLVDATAGMTGGFNNLLPGGDVQVSGLDAAHSAPLGAAYRLKQTPSAGHTLLQLSYEKLLVLSVNRDSGQMSIKNPFAGSIGITDYSVRSDNGDSLVTGFAGLGAGTPGAGTWVKAVNNSQNGLFEYKQAQVGVPDVPYDLTSVSSVSIGTGFDRDNVAADIANFGNDGEDLVFEYNTPTGGTIRGHIEYIGSKFENNLVLRVNPNTGQAFVKNDSNVTLKFDGYSILSSNGAGDLNGTGFTGLGGSWLSSPATGSALTQTNLTGSTTLAPGAQLAIGDISSTNFTSAAAQAGLSMQFILSEGLTSSAASGDYNNNGVVDAADYTTWRDRMGQTFTLTNVNPAAATPTIVDQEDYDFWKAQFGMTGGAVPETTFRVGSIFFDATAGSGGGGLGGLAVPEPNTGLLLLMGVGAVVALSRSRIGNQRLANVHSADTSEEVGQVGANIMSRRFNLATLAVLAVSAVIMSALPAAAVTQGIPLTNANFELPGPPGEKVVAFDATGVPIAGIIPGWTFTGGAGGTGETNPGVGNSLFGDGVPGDSGTEGGGNPGNELLLSTLDGKVFQTSAFNVVSIPATQKYRLSFDAHNIFAPTGQTQLSARLYYVDLGGNRQTIGSQFDSGALAGFQNYAIEFVGGSAALTPALGRLIGVEFDTTSREFDVTVTESWAGVDNVLLQITGVAAGDLNGDGLVNSGDYTVVRNNQQTAQLYNANGEVNGDGFVNLDDFRAIKTLIANAGSGSLSGGGVPEPSSLALTLIVAAAAAGISGLRRKPGSVPRLPSLLLAVFTLGVSLTSVSESKAELLAYDPFAIGANPAAGEYTEGLLVPQNPTIGPANPSFFRDPWTLGSAGQTVQATSINYLGSPSIGGSVNGFGRSERYLTNAWTDATEGTFYIGFEVNFGSTPDGNMGYRAVEFFPPDVVPGENRIGDIGYNQFFSTFGAPQQSPLTAKIQFNIGPQQIVIGAPESYNEDGVTHLMVLKVQLSTVANSDTVSLILDPTSSTEPDLPNNTATGFNFNLGSIGSASFGNGAGPTTVFDEIRVGTTFLDVIPELPLPGDTNGDGFVDIVDFNSIVAHLNLTGQSTLNGDVAGADGKQGADGKVDLRDIQLWRKNRSDLPPGAGAGSLAGAGVPEPTSLVLALSLVIGWIGLMRRTR